MGVLTILPSYCLAPVFTVWCLVQHSLTPHFLLLLSGFTPHIPYELDVDDGHEMLMTGLEFG
jgi:hypothetical protein